MLSPLRLLVLLLANFVDVQSLSLDSNCGRHPTRRKFGAGLAGLVCLSPPEVVRAAEETLDFTVIRETKLPFSQYYIENANRLVTNLQWVVHNPDADAVDNIKKQISKFNLLYRRDNYTQYGPLPGFQALLTAYSAASEHYARYGSGTPMNERLIGTIDRNLAAARKALDKSELTLSKMTELRGV